MSRNTDITNRFNSLLVEYLNLFNYIELNVGLCVRFLSGIEEKVINKKLDGMSFDKKLEYLLKLTAAHQDKYDLHVWCENAHKKRHERNMYMHGQWKIFPAFEECVEFHVAPWVKEKYSDIYPGSRFTIEKLESIVDDIRECFEKFGKLRNKYRI